MIAELSLWTYLCQKSMIWTPTPNIVTFVCTSSCQATFCVLLIPLCPCFRQYILYEAVKFDDSFPLLSCGPQCWFLCEIRHWPSGIAASLPMRKKERQRTQRVDWEIREEWCHQGGLHRKDETGKQKENTTLEGVAQDSASLKKDQLRRTGNCTGRDRSQS